MGFDRRHRTGMVPCCCSNGRPGRPRQYRPHTTGRSWSRRKSPEIGKVPGSTQWCLAPGAATPGSGNAELGLTDRVEVGDRGASVEIELEAVGGERDTAGAALEAFEHRASVDVVARAARGGADVHHVAPPG